MPSLADLIRMGKQYVSDALPGGSLNPEVNRQGILDGAALSTTAVPVLGDLLGLGADISRYATDPESRTAGNFALSGLGMLPFVPAMAGIFAGKGAKTADLAKQGLAEKMLQAGDDPVKVWSQTGWGIGPDGKWRFEIPDNAASPLSQSGKAAEYMSDAGVATYPSTIGGVMSHPSLFNAYDDLPKAHVTMENRVSGASYSPNTPDGGRILETFDLPMKHRGGSLLKPDQAKSTTLHELQHAIQQREGFARGGAPGQIADVADVAGKRAALFQAYKAAPMNSPEWHAAADALTQFDRQANYETYKRLGGEAEARLTQARMNMDAPQRAASYPWEPGYFEGATGVRLGDLINRFDDSGPSMMTAWHGSPHKFDKFSLDKIGTGEGAQAYGHGLYLAESPEVAVAYRNKLATDSSLLNPKVVTFKDGTQVDVGTSGWALNMLKKGNMDAEGARAAINAELSDATYLKNQDAIAKARAALRAVDDGSFEISGINAGSLYKTDIPDEAVARFLDWDKPLSQQAPEVNDALQLIERNKLKEIVKQKINSRAELIAKGGDTSRIDRQIEVMVEEINLKDIPFGGTGESYYKSLRNRLGDQNDASSYLKQQGISGIRYLDGGSRSAGQGSSNFVAFDPEMIRILERNGQPTGLEPWKPGEYSLKDLIPK